MSIQVTIEPQQDYAAVKITAVDSTDPTRLVVDCWSTVEALPNLIAAATGVLQRSEYSRIRPEPPATPKEPAPWGSGRARRGS